MRPEEHGRGQKRVLEKPCPPPPPPPLRPSAPSVPPPRELLEQRPPNDVKGKGGKEIQRGGWFNKAQEMCSAILQERWDDARELAIRHYAKKSELILLPGVPSEKMDRR